MAKETYAHGKRDLLVLVHTWGVRIHVETSKETYYEAKETYYEAKETYYKAKETY